MSKQKEYIYYSIITDELFELPTKVDSYFLRVNFYRYIGEL